MSAQGFSGIRKSDPVGLHKLVGSGKPPMPPPIPVVAKLRSLNASFVRKLAQNAGKPARVNPSFVNRTPLPFGQLGETTEICGDCREIVATPQAAEAARRIKTPTF
jgi:hypothetical protein